MQYTSSTVKLWALVDCNSFYCNCERLFKHKLRDKPVVVLSNNDGCLIALTPEAKALGFSMGEVYFQVADKLREHKISVFSSNYTLYADISQRVMGTLKTVAPHIDQYSIDEAFVPFDAVLAAQPDEVGWEMHDRVAKWVGMPVRVGIGPTRTLAKLANHWAKKKTRVYRLEPGTPEFESILESTPVGEVWGVGRRQAKKLLLQGIRNAKQLRDMDLDKALRLLTVVGQRTVYELRGFQCIMMDTAPMPRKTLVSSRSFGRRTRKKEELAESLAMHASIAGQRLRMENMVASALSIWCESSHHMEEEYFCIRGTVNLGLPTNITPDLIKAAHTALESCYRPNHGFMKGGILLFGLAEEGNRQLTLMEAALPGSDAKRRALMRAMDKINDKYGRNTLHAAAQGEADAPWRMRRHKMSPCYTTCLKDFPKVKTS